MKYKVSQYLTSASVENGSGDNSQKVVFSTRTGQSVLMKERLYSYLLANNFEQIPITILEQLFKLEMIVPADEDEFSVILAQDRLADADATTLTITIQPTANCQFGCHYCGQVHQKHNASDDLSALIVERLRQKLINNKKYDHLFINWYGGEPLLAYSQIKATSTALRAMTKELGVTYSASMITNGLSLKPEIFKELYLKHNVYSFQITMDGTKEHHDVRRVTKEGLGTFDIILSNIMKITALPDYTRSSKKPILIRMNVDVTNYKSIPQMIDLLAESGLADKVTLQYAPIFNWGDLKAGDEVGLSKEEFGKYEIDWMVYANSKGFKIPGIMPTRSYHPCMVTMKDGEVYDAYGNIYPCYEFSYTPVFETSDYTIGNLKNSEDTFNYKAKPRDWFDKVEEGKTSWCKSCKFFPVCAGGCPKQWYAGESACPSFKFNFEDRLVIQYMESQKRKLSLAS